MPVIYNEIYIKAPIQICFDSCSECGGSLKDHFRFRRTCCVRGDVRMYGEGRERDLGSCPFRGKTMVNFKDY